MMYGNGMILGWFIWAVILVGAICLGVYLFAPKRSHSEWHHDDPIQILKERLARGEINSREYDERRRTLMHS